MNSDTLRQTLRQAEGEKLKVYADTKGIPTIGVGRNLRDKGISRAESDYLLTNDITEAWHQLLTALPWVNDLSDVRQRALTEMTFQMGIGWISEFTHAVAALKAGDWARAKVELLDSKWANVDSPSRAHRVAVMVETDSDVH